LDRPSQPARTFAPKSKTSDLVSAVGTMLGHRGGGATKQMASSRRKTGRRGFLHSVSIQQVPHLHPLRAQIRLVLDGRLDDERHALEDVDAEAAQLLDLDWVVRQQANLLDAEVVEDARGIAIVAEVGGEAEVLVRLDCVET